MKRRRKAREGVEPLKLMVPVVLPWFLRPDRMSCGARGARGERVGQRPTAGCILPSLFSGSLRQSAARIGGWNAPAASSCRCRTGPSARGRGGAGRAGGRPHHVKGGHVNRCKARPAPRPIAHQRRHL